MTRPNWTRKTYEMVADILKEGWNESGSSSVKATALRFAHDFSIDNPNFDRQRFMTAIFGESK